MPTRLACPPTCAAARPGPQTVRQTPAWAARCMFVHAWRGKAGRYEQAQSGLRAASGGHRWPSPFLLTEPRRLDLIPGGGACFRARPACSDSRWGSGDTVAPCLLAPFAHTPPISAPCVSLDSYASRAGGRGRNKEEVQQATETPARARRQWATGVQGIVDWCKWASCKLFDAILSLHAEQTFFCAPFAGLNGARLLLPSYIVAAA